MIKTLKILFLLLTVCYATIASSQNNATLILWHTDGTTTDVELYLRPKVQFTNDKLLIMSSVLDMEFPSTEILRFTYKGGETSIDTPHDVAAFSREGEHILFHGVSNSEQVAVYTAAGIRVPIRTMATDDGVVLILSSVPRGVFVLSVNGKNYKISHS